MENVTARNENILLNSRSVYYNPGDYNEELSLQESLYLLYSDLTLIASRHYASITRYFIS